MAITNLLHSMAQNPFPPMRPLETQLKNRKQVVNKRTEIGINSKMLKTHRRGLGLNPLINKGERPYIAVEKLTECNKRNTKTKLLIAINGNLNSSHKIKIKSDFPFELLFILTAQLTKCSLIFFMTVYEGLKSKNNAELTKQCQCGLKHKGTSRMRNIAILKVETNTFNDEKNS